MNNHARLPIMQSCAKTRPGSTLKVTRQLRTFHTQTFCEDQLEQELFQPLNEYSLSSKSFVKHRPWGGATKKTCRAV